MQKIRSGLAVDEVFRCAYKCLYTQLSVAFRACLLFRFEVFSTTSLSSILRHFILLNSVVILPWRLINPKVQTPCLSKSASTGRHSPFLPTFWVWVSASLEIYPQSRMTRAATRVIHGQILKIYNAVPRSKF